MNGHPSRLALDRAAFEEPSSELQQHLAGCAECRDHLALIRSAPPVPAWVRELPKREPAWRRWFRLPTLVGTGVLAAACALLLMMRPDYVGEKGTEATFAVHVLRGGQRFIYSGAEKLRAGDRVQLEASARGYRQVAVGAIDAGGAVQPLYVGALVAGARFLPASWTLDAAPGPERLVIAFSDQPLSAAQLADAARRQPRGKPVQASVIELQKEPR
jgi:hypothetical protein